MRYWLYKEETDKNNRGTHGDSGGMSLAISKDDNDQLKYEHDSKPKVGVMIRVGSLYARSFSSQDWWQTTKIIEILEDSDSYVKFKTQSGSIYEWKIE